MLLDEDPATVRNPPFLKTARLTHSQLIRHTIGNFNIQPDKHSVSRINDSLSTLAQARDLQLREHKTALQRLQRKHQTLSSHHNELVSSHTPTAHSTRIADLDTKKFRTAKAASDLEIDCEKLSSHLADLSSHLQSLQIQGIDGYLDLPSQSTNPSNALTSSQQTNLKFPTGPTPTEQDAAAVLELFVFRSLGIEDAGYTKEGYRKLVVRNEERGDVGSLELNPKFSAYFFANFIWGYL